MQLFKENEKFIIRLQTLLRFLLGIVLKKKNDQFKFYVYFLKTKHQTLYLPWKRLQKTPPKDQFDQLSS